MTSATAGIWHQVIPSPTQAVWYLGPLPIRAYALCIIAGIVVAVWLGERRLLARGARPGLALDIAAWAVPFGIIGGRVYHVITTPDPYFGPKGDPMAAFSVWNGGLGIWGAIALGGVGAWIAARRHGVALPPVADALAPGIALAQAIGRWGNWFNNELYGSSTSLPWGLQIHKWDPTAGGAVTATDGNPVVLGTFHPAFLYESVWDVGTAVAVIWADRRFRMGHGRAFALYVALYTGGRFWIEALRIDEANHILGLRLNLWTSMIVFAGAVAYLLVSARLRPGRENDLSRGGAETSRPGEATQGGAEATESDDAPAGGAGEPEQPDRTTILSSRRPRGRPPRGDQP